MHLALKAYQELLLTVNEMDCSPDENIRQSSSVIKSETLTVLPQSHRLNPPPAESCAKLRLFSLWPCFPGNIFYLMEYREIFLTLLRKYDETKQPQSYLKDLVESTHLFLRMLERFSKGRKNLMVQVNDAKQPL